MVVYVVIFDVDFGVGVNVGKFLCIFVMLVYKEK